MRLITWNCNSIKARKQRLLALLERHEPDIVCLQELKFAKDNFPYDDIDAAGYHAAVHAQPTYNGVAILSKKPPDAVVTGFNDDAFEDPHARLVTAHFKAQSLGPKWKAGCVIAAYFPNGQSVTADKFIYKLDWMDRLRRTLHRRHDPTASLILAGDFNVAPTDHDAANPTKWRESVLCHPRARTLLARITEWGLHDCFRKVHPTPDDKHDTPAEHKNELSWWDYRSRGWDNNDGLRIDHIHATAPLAELTADARVDLEERDPESHDTPPSDHAPVIADFDL
jgi:exodeoxyribonuclease-3